MAESPFSCQGRVRVGDLRLAAVEQQLFLTPHRVEKKVGQAAEDRGANVSEEQCIFVETCKHEATAGGQPGRA